MKRSELIKLQLEERNPEAILLDNLDEALIGFATIQQNDLPVAIYSETRIIEILKKGNSWSYVEALDYFYQKIVCASSKPHTPIIVTDLASHTA